MIDFLQPDYYRSALADLAINAYPCGVLVNV